MTFGSYFDVVATHLSFWIRRENVILRRHLCVAREPAFGTAWIKFGRLKGVGRGIKADRHGTSSPCSAVRVLKNL
jgi:hypothetical protein